MSFLFSKSPLVDDLDNDWFWYDETPFTDFDAWGRGEPNGDGDCAIANMDGGNSPWEEADCMIKTGVYCKAPKGILTLTKCGVHLANQKNKMEFKVNV